MAFILFCYLGLAYTHNILLLIVWILKFAGKFLPRPSNFLMLRGSDPTWNLLRVSDTTWKFCDCPRPSQSMIECFRNSFPSIAYMPFLYYWLTNPDDRLNSPLIELVGTAGRNRVFIICVSARPRPVLIQISYLDLHSMPLISIIGIFS